MGAVMPTLRTSSGRTSSAPAPSRPRKHNGKIPISTRNGEESTRERILTSATRLFAERGFESASMPDIAKAAGITAGAIYKHFESKGDLLLEVVTRSFLSSPLFAHGSERENDATALPHLAALYTDPDLKLVRQLSIEVHSAASKDSKVGQVLSKSDRLVMDHLSASVAMAQKAGQLDPGLNPAHVARAFCIFIMGLIHMDTLLPEMVGDHAWRDFIRERVSTLIGVRSADED
jgi:AcrR family transcriptional regulator